MATITSPRPQSPTPNFSHPTHNNDSSSYVAQPLQSPSLTPSSSVRASLDIPADGNGYSKSPVSNQTQSQPPRRNNRAALRDYYNLKSKPPGSQPASSTGPSRTSSVSSITTTLTNSNDPSQFSPSHLGPTFDSADFNPKDYVRQLLQTSSLQTLLKTESALISEVRQLDGERKALVYDNYSKLIGATEMIGSMIGDKKSQYQEMLSGPRTAGLSLAAGVGHVGKNGTADVTGRVAPRDVERLRDMVDKIHTQVSHLERQDKSHTDAAKAEKRRFKKDQRQKKELVRWVAQAPGRLESLARDGKDHEVKEEWAKVKELLDSWNGVKGVDEVRAKCQAVVHSLEQDDGT